MKDILVTGGAGFIGSHLCEELVAQDHAVTCIDNLSTGTLDNISHLPSLRFIEADVNKPDVFHQLRNEQFDVIFHYAATVGVKRTEENPHLVLADTYGIQHVAEFARRGKAKQILFASSSEVYGDSKQQPVHEASGHNAYTPYSAVKIYGEHLYQSLWTHGKTPTTSLRFFNVYGPRQIGNMYGFVIAKFIRQVLAGKSPTIYGDGEQTRDFVFVKDNIAAALAAMEEPKAAGSILNIGTGRETRVIDLAQAIIRVADKENEIAPVFKGERTYEIHRRCADMQILRELLDFSCETELHEGLAYLFEYERQQWEEKATEDGPAVAAPAPAEALPS